MAWFIVLSIPFFLVFLIALGLLMVVATGFLLAGINSVVDYVRR